MAMNRRDALKSVVLMMGGTMVGANVILTGCAPDDQIVGLEFSPKDIAFLDEIGEAIIPTTDTPGAKAVGIGGFMVMMVKDTYNTEQQTAFVDGLNFIKKDFKSSKGRDFMDATLEERTAYLNELKAKATADTEDKNAGVVKMLQDLTVLGYFTSEIGATQQLRYYEVPGKYDPCIEYKPGEKAYAI
ncbi:gluconate 2-dehydrogenase subunit 3 family protein [Aquiflexum gelatinilyticum]|uniref:Gluconate 2-dehydrogenase subunit 3 family protein n=1 Tax=Aquiflexum gelatinilyticum TaxID=2961943 RepID=A0A9X2PAQ6_9BACT|nr:gluconate 2-dehydrogenase subunit 3 family protein [Aquiflexum gelatinilyticum]MCR9016572.1 gluconate 2-dehydrogenase subunit 3 family protein [Aquiflexum gelatinilyticum]